MPEGKIRYEWKHVVNLSDCIALRQRLRLITVPDQYASYNGTCRIRNVYFDSFKQRRLATDQTEKFRIRCYNGDDSRIYLEKKKKIGERYQKEAIPITREECHRLLHGDVEWMTDSKRPLLVELYAKMCYQNLRPKALVDYLRESFLYPAENARVTIDSNIRSGLNAWDFFRPSLSSMRTCTRGTAILEVEYDTDIPDIISDIIQMCNRPYNRFPSYNGYRLFG